MASLTIEEAREASGVLSSCVTAWMKALCLSVLPIS